MKNAFRYLGVVIATCITFILILTFNINVGILKSDIEKDARINHKIAEDWAVTKSTTNNTSAMIFYNGNIDNHIFSIYRNMKELSFGYFFRAGGSIVSNIGLYQLNETEEQVYLSMNKQQVIRAEINSGCK